LHRGLALLVFPPSHSRCGRLRRPTRNRPALFAVIPLMVYQDPWTPDADG